MTKALNAEVLTKDQVRELHSRGRSFETDGYYPTRCSICGVPVHFDGTQWVAEPNRVNFYTNVCPRGDTTTGWGAHYVNLSF